MTNLKVKFVRLKFDRLTELMDSVFEKIYAQILLNTCF